MPSNDPLSESLSVLAITKVIGVSVTGGGTDGFVGKRLRRDAPTFVLFSAGSVVAPTCFRLPGIDIWVLI